MKKEFDIFYNALSVGWHLAKIMEIEPKLIKDIKDWKKLVGWLERHKIKNDKK